MSLLSFGVAPAEALRPAGCNQYFLNPWSSSCTHSRFSGDVNRTISVLGLQFILNKLRFGNVNPDCVFGPNTASGMASFQQFYGLTQDGIAGPNTLRTLESQLVYSGFTEGSRIYYNIQNQDGLRFFYQAQAPVGWYVLNNSVGRRNGYTAMGPAYDGFCV